MVFFSHVSSHTPTYTRISFTDGPPYTHLHLRLGEEPGANLENDVVVLVQRPHRAPHEGAVALVTGGDLFVKVVVGTTDSVQMFTMSFQLSQKTVESRFYDKSRSGKDCLLPIISPFYCRKECISDLRRISN